MNVCIQVVKLHSLLMLLLTGRYLCKIKGQQHETALGSCCQY